MIKQLPESPHIQSYKQYEESLSGRLQEWLKEMLDMFLKEGIIEKDVLLDSFKLIIAKPLKNNDGECLSRRMSYESNLAIEIKLSQTQGSRNIELGSMLEMTRRGSFIYNGLERCLVAQLSKSPGVYFYFEEKEEGRFVGPEDRRNVLVRYAKADVCPEEGVHFTFRLEIEPPSDPEKYPKPVRVMFPGGRTAHTTTFLIALGFSAQELHGMALPLSEERRAKGGGAKGYVDKGAIGHIAQCLGLGHIAPESGLSINKEDWEILSKAIQSKVFSSRLGKLGRKQLKRKLNGAGSESYLLVKEDILAILTGLRALIEGRLPEDDKWDLGNLRVRLVRDYLDSALNKWMSHMTRRCRKLIKNRYGEDKADADMLVSIIQEANEDREGLTHFTRFLNEWLVKSPMSQLIPPGQKNLVEAASLTRKITYNGWGGIAVGREREPRAFHPSHYGRLCPIDTPQSNEVGISLSMSVGSRVNDVGIIEARVHKVNWENGKITISEEDIWLSPWDEDKWIAFADQKDTLLKGEKVQAHKGSKALELEWVKAEQVGFIHPSEDAIFSIAANLIPYRAHNDAVRGVMACSFLKQALPLRNPEAPSVKTGYESIIREKYPFPYGVSAENGDIALGKQLIVGYMPWKGWNFEDAFAISQSASEKMTDVEKTTFVVRLRSSIETVKGQFHALNKSLPEGISLENYENGIIKKGTSVAPGDFLVFEYKYRRGIAKPIVSGRSLRKDKKIHGKVAEVEEVRQEGQPDQLVITIENNRRATVGDKFANRHGNKGVISVIFDDHEMPYFVLNGISSPDQKACKCGETKPHQHLEMLIHPSGVVSRMNIGQLKETGEAGKNVACFDPALEKGEERKLKNEVFIGTQYVMKLDHNAEDKVHGRSRVAGGYSSFVQQPQKGKKLMGGQRLGEMEVWSLMAHNASAAMKEFLTLKSDNPRERKILFNKLIHGQDIGALDGGKVPEALKTLSALCFGMGLSLTLQSEGRRLSPLERNISAGRIDSVHLALLNSHGFASEDTQEGISHGEVNTTISSGKAYEYLCNACKETFRVFGSILLGKRKITCTSCGSNDIQHYYYRCRTCKTSLTVNDFQEGKEKDKCPKCKDKTVIEAWPVVRYRFNPSSLESEQIFGPLRDYSCACGRYQRAYKSPKEGIYECTDCGTPLVPSYHRRMRMGHIVLAATVPNPFILCYSEDYLRLFIGLTMSEFDSIIMGKPKINFKTWDDAELFLSVAIASSESFKQAFEKKTKERLFADTKSDKGAYDTLSSALSTEQKNKLDAIRGKSIAQFISHRKAIDSPRAPQLRELGGIVGGVIRDCETSSIELLAGMLRNNKVTKNICIENLPVIPPVLRRRFDIPGVKKKPHDLTELYQGVIAANNAFSNFLKGCPERKSKEDITQYKEFYKNLYIAVSRLMCNDALSPNLRARDWSIPGDPVRYSLSSHIGGKEGLIVGNLLGKRVDFSGRAVIVPDPNLGLDECRIPLSLAIDLFKPHLIANLGGELTKEVELKLQKAKDGDEEAVKEIKLKLEPIVAANAVLLNRQPTLHMLGMLAFKAKIANNEVISLPPLVTKGYNADFDGDQMALYLPVTREAKALMPFMYPSKHIWHPADGSFSLSLDQDIALGGYLKGKGKKSLLRGELENDNGCSDLDDKIKKLAAEAFEITAKEGVSVSIEDFEQISYRCGVLDSAKAETCIKNMIEQNVLPKSLSSIFLSGDKDYKPLTAIAGTIFGNRVKSNLTKGLTTSEQLLLARHGRGNLVDTKLGTAEGGYLTKILVSLAQNIWITEDDCCSDSEPDGLRVSATESVWMILEDSSESKANAILKAALGSSGKIDAVLYDEKGFGESADMWMSTKISETDPESILNGHPSRIPPRLVAVRILRQLASGNEDMERILYARLYGRVLAQGYDKFNKGFLIGSEAAKDIAQSIIEKKDSVTVRSPFTCKSSIGICKHCYGLPMTRGRKIRSWNETDFASFDARVGIIAAQAVGERGTQMALGKKHLAGGGTESNVIGINQVKRCLSQDTPLLCDDDLSSYRDTIDYIYRSNALSVTPVHFEVLFAGLMRKLSSIGRRMLEDLVSVRSGAVIKQAEVGIVKGCLLETVKADSLYEHLGMQDGDIILTVNNIKTESPEELYKAFEALRTTEGFSLRYWRAGRVKKQRYQISGATGWIAPASHADATLDIELSTLHIIAAAALRSGEDALEGLKEHAFIGDGLPSSIAKEAEE